MNPFWRTLLFVPATHRYFVERAHTRGADAIILDLEDSIPAHSKDAARESVADAVDHLHSSGAAVAVRINDNCDLQFAVRHGVAALVVPKVDSAQALRFLDADISRRERAAGLPDRTIGVIALIETPAALFALPDLASAPRVIGLALGSEDFALALGTEPGPASLTLPAQWLALAAGSRGIMALGLPDTLANYHDLDRMTSSAAAARAMGLTGALCTHPAQIPVINTEFAPSEREVLWARRVHEQWSNTNAGAISVDGEMIDRPVALRAQRILEGLGHA